MSEIFSQDFTIASQYFLQVMSPKMQPLLENMIARIAQKEGNCEASSSRADREKSESDQGVIRTCFSRHQPITKGTWRDEKTGGRD